MDTQSHPVMFRNNPALFVGAILLVPVFGVGLVILLCWRLKTLATTLIITEDRIIKRQGILSKYTGEIYYRDVKSIQIKQTFWNRIFNVGTVGVASSGHHGLVLVFIGWKNPEGLKQIIEREVQKSV